MRGAILFASLAITACAAKKPPIEEPPKWQDVFDLDDEDLDDLPEAGEESDTGDER